MAGLGLLLFLFAIINLGDLGLVVAALQRGVEGAARKAAVTAAANLSSGAACPSESTIQGYFTSFASPPLNAANATLSYTGSPWITNDASLPGTYVVMTATYKWVPIGFTSVLPTINLSLTAAAFVMGTGSSTTC